MAIFFFLGNPIDFPMAPYFIPELAAAPWIEDFRVVSKKSYQIFIHEKANGQIDSRKKLVTRQLESDIAENRFKFCEAAYLSANADIAEAVEAKNFSSGFHHYLAHGISENRPAKVCFHGDAETVLRIETEENAISQIQPGTHCVQMLAINDHSALGASIPYANRKIQSKTLHQVFFCEPWLAYDLAWNISQKVEKESLQADKYIDTISI